MNRTPFPRPSTVLVPATLTGALLVAVASAAPISNPDALVQSAVGGDGHVWVSIDDEGVATLRGYVDSGSTRLRAARAALKSDEVERVINLISDD